MEIKIALAQLEVKPGHPYQNTLAMLKMIEDARAAKAQLIVFPEMSIPGYLLGDTWEQPAFLRECEAMGKRICAASADICIIFGNVAIDWEKRNDDGRPRKYNACFIAYQGRFIGAENFPYPYRIKTLQPDYREFEDSRHFYSLRKLALEKNQTLFELSQPVRLKLAEKELSLACLLCEDAWSDDYAFDPLQAITAKGQPDLIINISSSPYTYNKNQKRNRVFAAHAGNYHAPLIYVNNTGLQNNGKTVYAFDGFSSVYRANGEVAAYLPPFQSGLTYFDLSDQTAVCKLPPEDPVGELYQALRYGLENFLAALNIERVVVGLSGGIDSALAAAFYREVLGPDNVLLINMPSRFNSETTRNLSSRLAENLGCPYMIIPIQEAVDHTIRQLSETPIRQSGKKAPALLTVSSFAQENIQARDRSARILAGAAAAFGGAFTCNANKSETTVGYSTLYGDQSGFFALLADLWKHQVYALAEHFNRVVFQSEVIPQGIIDIIPSAELSAAQAVDEGKGDPLHYPYHDYLFRSFVERWQRATPEDILSWYAEDCLEEQIGCRAGLINELFPDAKEFISDLERWWRQYCGMGIAKRIQAPPIMAVSRRAFGFDQREAQNGVYFTQKYLQLKAALLA